MASVVVQVGQTWKGNSERDRAGSRVVRVDRQKCIATLANGSLMNLHFDGELLATGYWMLADAPPETETTAGTAERVAVGQAWRFKGSHGKAAWRSDYLVTSVTSTTAFFAGANLDPAMTLDTTGRPM